MNLKLKSTMFISAAAMIAATFSTPAFAQRGGRDRNNGQQQSQTQSRGGQQAQPRQSAPPPRQAEPQRVQPQRVQPQRSTPPQQQRRVEPQRVPEQRVDPRRVEPRNDYRGNDYRGNDFRGYNGGRTIVQPRGYAVPRRDWRPGYFEPRHVIRIYRPYYSFRPRLNLGFGFFLGYSVPYPSFYDPYAYDPYYPGGYAITPGAAYGGVSFDIQPYDAQIFVDGIYVGDAQDFGPEDAPLTLTSGRHHIEVRASGYQVMAFDANILPGQVLPYQGTLGFIR